ncbi:hypothetical protein ACO2Q9_05060 [Variovorax sp. VNK109]|uniref:hypothetical protein n=1 Tax=Variovorax sp. VNK109 TaxID=3400919 RepID=UPI003C11749C
MKKLLIPLVCAIAAGSAVAKLPPPNDAAKAKAAETAARTAWTTKKEGYLLCQAQNRVAAHYLKTAKAAGKDVKPMDTPPCADPGPFVYTPPAEVRPIEAAGAHSPATTTGSPPNNTAKSASEVAPAKKP